MLIRILIRTAVVPIRGKWHDSCADKNPYRHDPRADSLSQNPKIINLVFTMLNICFTVGGLLHVHEKVNNFKFNIFINFSGAQYDTNAVDRTLCGENEGVQISCAVTSAADQGLCFICALPTSL